MPDIHESVGYMTLTGKVLLGLADSDDDGEQTDASAAVATVTITPSIPGVVVVADESVVRLTTIRAALNASGQLVAPADGQSTVGTSTSLRLIAPDQAAISEVGWQYVIDIAPVDGKSFTKFTVFLTGAKDEAKTIGGLILAGHTPQLSTLLSAIEVTGTGVDDALTLADIPDGTPSGTVVANTAVDPTAFYIYR